jgi:hypothetical protein
MANLQASDVGGTLTALRLENTTTVSKSLQLADRDRVVSCNNTSTITITVPADGTVNSPVGSVVYINKINTGSVLLAAEGGVTLTKTGQLAQYEEMQLRKRASNFWVVVDASSQYTYTGGTLSSSGTYTIRTFSSTGASTLTVS